MRSADADAVVMAPFFSKTSSCNPPYVFDRSSVVPKMCRETRSHKNDMFCYNQSSSEFFLGDCAKNTK